MINILRRMGFWLSRCLVCFVLFWFVFWGIEDRKNRRIQIHDFNRNKYHACVNYHCASLRRGDYAILSWITMPHERRMSVLPWP